MFYGIDIILQNILTIMLNMKNIPYNIVSPKKQCDGYE